MKQDDSQLQVLEQVCRRLRERRYREILDDPPECSLAELRKSGLRSQCTVAAALGVSQIAVSRLERRPDLLVSTLSNYVEALGGNLELIVRFPRRAARLRLPEPQGSGRNRRSSA